MHYDITLDNKRLSRVEASDYKEALYIASEDYGIPARELGIVETINNKKITA